MALALVNEGAKARKFNIRAVAGEPVGRRLADMAERVAERGRAFRAASVEEDADFASLAAPAGLRGPLLAAPLTLKDHTVGVLLVGRLGEEAFSDSDLRLLVTLADQTAAAIENARLYTEVRAFSENLEIKGARPDRRAGARQGRDREGARRSAHGADAARALRAHGGTRAACGGHRARGELTGGGGAGLRRRAGEDGAPPRGGRP